MLFRSAWSCDSLGQFFGSGNRNSTAVATASFENKESEVSFRSVDSIADDRIDYIKYDVEGAEREALDGSHLTVERYHPSLLISVYHRSRDIFELPLLMAKRYAGYRFYLRRLKCLPAWEIDLILIPC